MDEATKKATKEANQKVPAKVIEEFIKNPISDTALIFIAIGVFAVGSFLFAGVNLLKKGKYRDWSINTKDACIKILENKKNADVLYLGQLEKVPVPKGQKPNPAIDTVKKRIELLGEEIFRIETSWDTSNAVVPAGFRSNILFKKNSFINPSDDFEEDSVFFYYQLKDTDKLVKVIRLNGFLMPFKSKSIKTNIEFFKKYPTTGFWSILSIVQFVFWGIVFCVSISLLRFLIDDMKDKGITADKGVIPKIIWATAITVIAFLAVFFLCIYDKQYKFDSIFMNGFEWAMVIYGLVGYITAGVLLASFLLTAYYVKKAKISYGTMLGERSAIEAQIKEKIKHLKVKMEELKVTESPVAAEEIKNLESVAEDKARDLALLKEQYKTCKKYFNFFFAIAAVILSVLVIWVGSLFASINSIEYFTFLRNRAGYSYLPYDFVYLYAALHTVLLFIFYVPVKLRLLSMSFSIPDQNETGDGTALKDTFKKVFARIIEILAASSPLLAAMLQKLFE